MKFPNISPIEAIFTVIASIFTIKLIFFPPQMVIKISVIDFIPATSTKNKALLITNDDKPIAAIALPYKMADYEVSQPNLNELVSIIPAQDPYS